MDELNHWLIHNWNPPQKKLILFGPSGGYCLLDTFISRFEKVIGVEIDPLARGIFQLRFGSHTQIQWITKDLFIFQKQLSTKPLSDLFSSYPDACILFSNLLGQLPFLYPKETEVPQYEAWKKGLVSLLKTRTSATFHDRLSGPLRPILNSPRSNHALSNQELLSRFYKSSNSSSKPAELIDHITEGLHLGSSLRYFSWEIYPKTHHLIEATQS